MALSNTPDNIGPSDLPENGIFVFGSNTKGVHGSGAALFAKLHFGAQQGVGEGWTGRCYAFPTLNADSSGGFRLERRTHDELVESVRRFAWAVSVTPEKTYYLTKVGCGLAGYSESHMREIFMGIQAPNLIKPKGW